MLPARPCDVVLSAVILLATGVCVDGLLHAKPSNNIEQKYFKSNKHPQYFRDYFIESEHVIPKVPIFIHHLQLKRAYQVLNKYMIHDMRLPNGEVQEEKQNTQRLFCWAFVKPPEDSGRGGGKEEFFYPELKELFSSSCSGWALYSNYTDPALGITKGHDGETGGHNQNSIQQHSIYDKFVRDPSIDYDWYIELDADVWSRFNFLKDNLLKEDNNPVFTSTGMIHLFNRRFLQDLRSHWGTLGKRRENRCPIYSPDSILPNCQGDVTQTITNWKRFGMVFNETIPMHPPECVGGYMDMGYLGDGWNEDARQLQYVCELVGQSCTAEPLCCPPQ